MMFAPIPAFTTFVLVTVGDVALSFFKQGTDPIQTSTAFPIAVYVPYKPMEEPVIDMTSTIWIVCMIIQFLSMILHYFSNKSADVSTEVLDLQEELQKNTDKFYADIFNLHSQVKTLSAEMYEKDYVIRSLKDINAELQANITLHQESLFNQQSGESLIDITKTAMEIIKNMTDNQRSSTAPKAPPLPVLPAPPPPVRSAPQVPLRIAAVTSGCFLDELKMVLKSRRND